MANVIELTSKRISSMNIDNDNSALHPKTEATVASNPYAKSIRRRHPEANSSSACSPDNGQLLLKRICRVVGGFVAKTFMW
jgi:hypothetical protein